jgi:hypothetical protein
MAKTKTKASQGKNPLQVKGVLMTPEKARKIQHNNIRSINRDRVRRYAEIMVKGAWEEYNGETIKFDTAGKLVDGAHRIAAVIEAGVKINFMAVYGVQSHMNIDTGVNRSIGLMLKQKGEINYNQLGSALKALFLFGKNKIVMSTGGADRPCVSELYTLLNKSPKIRDSVRYVSNKHSKTKKLAPTAAIICIHYLASMKYGRETADQFCQEIFTGANLDYGDPCFTYRKRIINEIDKSSSLGISPKERAALLTKAWNAWINGRELKQLQWRPKGPKKEKFPELELPKI